MFNKEEFKIIYRAGCVFGYNEFNKPINFVSDNDNEIVDMFNISNNKFSIYNKKEDKTNFYTANRFWSSGVSLYDNFGIIIVDVDYDILDMEQNNIELYEEIMKLKELSIAYIIGATNHMSILFKANDEIKEYFEDNKDILKDIVFETIKEPNKNGIMISKKTKHIEISHLSNHKLCFGLNNVTMNGESDGYYILKYNENNFNNSCSLEDISDIFNNIIDLMPEEYKVKSKKQYSSNNKKSFDNNNSNFDDNFLINQAKLLKDPERLYKKYEDKYPVGDGCRNNSMIKGYFPMFNNNPYVGDEEWEAFKDYIRENIDEDIDSINDTYKADIESKEVMEMPKMEGKNRSKYIGFMSLDFDGTFKRFVIEEDTINGGYCIYRPKNSSDSKALFGDIDFSNKIVEIQDSDNKRINDIIYEENGNLYFNHTANTVAQLKIRNEWLKNKDVYNGTELNENTYKIIHNILGDNTELFLKKEAIVTATLKKLKFLDIIGTEARSCGKSSIVRLLAKTRLPEKRWKEVKKFVAGRPETDGKKIKFAGSIHDSSVAMHLDEDGMDRTMFEFIKAIQSPIGVDAPKKGLDSCNINPAYINAYYTFNLSSDRSNIYYSKKDLSYTTTVCLTANKNALSIDELDVDLSYINSTECVYNLSKYLLALYNSMSEEEINNIICNYPSLSKYKLEDYLEETDKNKTETIIDEYIASLESGDDNNIKEFLLGDIFYNYMARSRVSSDVLERVKTYINELNSNGFKNYTYGVHKAVCVILNINTRKVNLTKYFSGKTDRNTYICNNNNIDF